MCGYVRCGVRKGRQGAETDPGWFVLCGKVVLLVLLM